MKNLHLLISVFIVIPVALIYGFQPDFCFDIQLNTNDEHNIFKAIMGLYLLFSILWIIGIYKSDLWKVATISNILFMFGLAFGRFYSMIFDGIPSMCLILGAIGEVVLGVYGLYVLKKAYINKNVNLQL